jgi:uncharacterized damage-inducible protein DinB
MTEAERRQAIAAIAAAPTRMREAVKGLSEGQLDTAYRDGGWTVRQVVHHVPDSHMNAYVRMKLTLTEDRPIIKPYDQERWAELPDSKGPIEPSLAILDGLHKRWVAVLQAIPEEAWARKLEHPESGTMTLDHVLALYAWHGAHHVAHITTLRERRGW